MDVEVTLGPQDLRALKACMLERRAIPTTALVMFPLLLWLIFSCGCLSQFPYVAYSLGDGAIIASVIMFGFGVILGASSVWFVKRVLVIRVTALLQQTIDRFVNTPWHLRINPAGVKVDSARFSVTYSWSYFPEIVQTGNHLFLVLGHYEALIVPRRAFATDQAFLSFAEACRRFFDHPPEPAGPVPSSLPTAIKTRPDEFTHGSPNR